MAKTKIPHKEYIKKQVENILSPFNMWVTGVAIGRPPTPEDAARHYAENGAELFCRQYEPVCDEELNNGRFNGNNTPGEH